jgi:hypothetical protein
MDALHKLLLTGEIFSGAVLGLIAVSTIFGVINKYRGLYVPWAGAQQVAAQELTASKEGWPHRALVAFDIWFNVTILRGQQDETISTHSWRAQQEGKLWGKLMCKWLNGFQPNHGFKAASGDLERAKSRVAQLSKMLGV